MIMLEDKCIEIIYYKCKLSLFGKDETRQAKSLIFTVAPKTEQLQVQKTYKKSVKKP